ncbi:transcriptional repressor [Psychrilyobacter sp.]|uniref:Fur family transcriptional regulator n=1 Tax=Psychrilyobacter sp. TaxID=2586924 RepID=UPI00301827D7
MKFSKKRELILNFVLNSDKHLTADFIYLELKKDCPELSLGTVYRNLSQLSDNGLIKKVSLNDQTDVFDKNLEKHGHLICDVCNSIYDINLDPLEEAIEKISIENDMSVKYYDIIFHGICGKCKN